MSKAMELLDDVILTSYCRDGMRHLGPGQVVMRLPPEKREILSQLTSDEVASVRPDTVFGPAAPKRKGRWGHQ